MLNVKEQLVRELNTILPTYYELFCDSTTETPCITYIENLSYDTLTGDTFGYSQVGFNIKVWGNDIGVLSEYMIKVDAVMRRLGFKRISYNEIVYNGQIELVGSYVGLGKENYE